MKSGVSSNRNAVLIHTQAVLLIDLLQIAGDVAAFVPILLLLLSTTISPPPPSHPQWRAKAQLPRCSYAIKTPPRHRVSPGLLQRRRLSLQLQFFKNSYNVRRCLGGGMSFVFRQIYTAASKLSKDECEHQGRITRLGGRRSSKVLRSPSWTSPTSCRLTAYSVISAMSVGLYVYSPCAAC